MAFRTNRPDDPYYQKVNHVRLAKNQQSKGWLDTFEPTEGDQITFDPRVYPPNVYE